MIDHVFVSSVVEIHYLSYILRKNNITHCRVFVFCCGFFLLEVILMIMPFKRGQLFLKLFVSDFVELLFFRPTRSSLKYGVDLCMTDQ